MLRFLLSIGILLSCTWAAGETKAQELSVNDLPQIERILVAGATGRVGRVAIADLNKAGFLVRGMTRNAAKAQLELGDAYEWVEADALDPATLPAAFEGVDRVICTIGVSTPGGSVTPEMLNYGGVKNLIDAAKAAGVKQFVFISSIGVSHRFHLLNITFDNVLYWTRQAEEYLRASGLSYSIIRPGGLREGVGGREAVVLEQGDRKGGRHVIIPDVAAVAVSTLNNAEAIGKTFEMLSDDTKPQADWRLQFKLLASDPNAGEFQDCAECPQMVVVPSGEFIMGSPDNERGRLYYEGPQRKVTIAAPFAVGKFEVTFDEWDACVADEGCGEYVPGDEGWGRSNRPVINVNWTDMQAYLRWLSVKAGYDYRLLSEAEWEYAARAGSTKTYSWGHIPNHNKANFGAETCCAGWAEGQDIWQNKTAPVGSFPPNKFGLYDMLGNVYERTADCWNPSYVNAPLDGSIWAEGDCTARVLRGGSWISSPEFIRAAERDAYNGYYRANVMGFRVARDLQPD